MAKIQSGLYIALLKDMAKRTIFTIGHSNRSKAEFLELLEENKVNLVIDVRRLPGSDQFPHFNQERLKTFLKKHKISYLHLEALGGRRRPLADSKNLGWKSASFRGYADYMQTEEFKKALERVIEKAKSKTIALMCAEAVPWRCHRGLIADSLIVRGYTVNDIISRTSCPAHHLPEWAKVRKYAKKNRLSYPG